MINNQLQKDKYNKSIIHNFEVSVVMPFYKRLREFAIVLPLNADLFQRNGIEVIIIMDEPTEEVGVIEFIKQYPFINWKVLVNDTKHAPRNPARVLNVGIRNATKKYIMVCSPETQMYTDVIFQLRNMLEHYPEHYAIGTVAFIQEDTIATDDVLAGLTFLPYGSFMCKKEYLEEVSGYDESLIKWGGDDDNIRKRLDMIGIQKLFLPESKSLHREKELRIKERNETSNSFSPEHIRKIHYPVIAKINGDDWGNDFKRITYDSKNKTDNNEELCRIYLNNFLKFEIKDSKIFKDNYKKIILCQAHNESELLPGFLQNMATYFDGIILLDDGSSDDTYNLAQHEKLLLKVAKIRTEFNDLQNRNILLNIATFFKSEWLCFMDIDERFDERFANFNCTTDNPDIDVVAFCFVHLWDDDNLYIERYPYTINGLFRMKRMFRNIGRMQINTTLQKLHFEASPLKRNIFNSNILVKHMGNLTKERRMRRYHFYTKEDTHKDQQSYEHLLVENPVLKNVDEITEELMNYKAPYLK